VGSFFGGLLGGLLSPGGAGGAPSGITNVAQATNTTTVRVGSSFNLDREGAILLGAMIVLAAVLLLKKR